jgi:hypothetical protein
MLHVRPTTQGVRFKVRLQPKARASEVVGVFDDALKVRVTAPPVDGAANEALVELLAATFVIPRRAITIVAGLSSRSKVVELVGVAEADVIRIANGEY